LENYKGKEFIGKSDLFTKRTIRQNVTITHCDTPQEALTVSMNERGHIDIAYMAELVDMPEQDVIRELSGQIYPLPETLDKDNLSYVTAGEYLSGNIKTKLRIARNIMEEHPELAEQVKVLEKALPEPISAAEIEVHLGATWVPVEFVNDFIVQEIISSNGNLPYEYRWGRKDPPHAEFFEPTSTWHIEGKKNDEPFRNQSREIWGVDHRFGRALHLLEACLNLKEVTLKDTFHDGDRVVSVVNEKLTAAARAKQNALQERFADWIFADPDRRTTLEQIYNDKFNRIRPREYDGSYMTFPGMSPSFELRPHQSAAVAHALFGGNTLFAHTVGAGKTAEMIATAMEGKRLGLHHKSLFVVPKHTIEQFAKEFMRIYPAANILVSRPQDFTPANRKKFCAKIAAGDLDAIVMSFSQFEKIPMSFERQEMMMEQQINEIMEAIEQSEDDGSFSTKQLVSMQKKLQLKLEKLRANDRKDDVVTFEELGVDKLFVDEAHYFKNAFMATKMSNVAGIGQSASQKCTDLDMKCQYLDEITDSRGIVFATGTPVTNTMSELYIMQRYLQRQRLKELGLGQFDNWASTFGQTETQMELAPEGSGYRMKTRFSKFYNVPELMRLFRECADVKMAGDLHLDVPEVTYHNIVAQPTPEQKAMVEELSKRAEKIHKREVSPEEDNMLAVTSDGRKIGLDARMIDPDAPDEAGSKINLCVDNVFQIWRKTAEERQAQIIFSDFSTPNPKKFNAYHDIRSKLIAKGVPEQEIAFIHDYNTDAAKAELFAKVRNGDVRVLLGSTQKLGVGTNVQTRLIATHDLDAPWRPGDLEQRAGRIIRQGNMNKHADIYRYVTNGTFDSYLFQILESKQRFISQIMSNKSNSRSCKDADEAVLNYAEIKALCAGDPRIRERMTLEVDVQKLKMLKSSHQSQIYRLQNDVRRTFPEQIKTLRNNINAYKLDIATLEANPMKPQKEGTALFAPMVVDGTTYNTRQKAGKALLEAAKGIPAGSHSAYSVGSWRGMEILVIRPMLDAPPTIQMKGVQLYSCEMSPDPAGNITRMTNRLEKLGTYLETDQAALANTEQQLEQAKALQFQPFPQEEELSEKSARLAELTQELSLDKKEQPQEEVPKAAEKQNMRLCDRLRIAKTAIMGRNGEQQNNPVKQSVFEH
jgi:N12 class adenine-specific DNA methylase